MERIAPPKPRLDVRDLEVVLALSAEKSTASAAKRLHLTQSAVSRALCLAEEKLGVRLFDRGARGLAPTVAGAKLIAASAPLLAQLVAIEDAVRGERGPIRLRLVCECYTAYRWLPSALAQLRRNIPGLEVALAIEHSNDPVAALRAGEIDVALLTTGDIERSAGLMEDALFADEIVCVMSSTHPLAKRRHVTAADLRAHPILTSNTPEAERRWFLRSVFGRTKPKLELIRLPLTEAIVDAARAGMGVAVMSEWIASGYLGGSDLVVRRFSAPLRRPWRVAFRRESADVAQRLASALVTAAPRLYAARAG